jgi:hypothetical protein
MYRILPFFLEIADLVPGMAIPWILVIIRAFSALYHSVEFLQAEGGDWRLKGFRLKGFRLKGFRLETAIPSQLSSESPFGSLPPN